MTGSAADAEDLVQETFVRALEHATQLQEEAMRPWLLRVAVNLSLDALRRRKRRRYLGAWLPAPIEAGETGGESSSGPDARYARLESISFAFLLALEVLTPRQRAVLLLRDVFDYSARETAAALDISEANVRIVHHRARGAMRAYDGERCVPTRA